MADKTTQSARIAAEMANTPSRAAVSGRASAIADRYRLAPEELPGGRLVGRIQGIATQGVEALTTLAHIEGALKPLALGADDVEVLVRLTGSPFASDWVGVRVEARAVRIDGVRMVRLFAPGASGPPVDVPETPRPSRRKNIITALGILLIIAVALLAVYLVEQGPALWTLLQDMLSSIGR